MTGTALLVLMLASCAGCSGPATATSTGPTPPAPPDAPVQAASPEATAVDPARCERLIQHAVDLAVAEAGITPDERASLEQETAARYGAECRNLPASVIDCALAAPTLDELAACSGDAE